MKIGILTFPDVINHGAYLQAYALEKTIESFGHEVCLINYRNLRHYVNEYKALLLKKNLTEILFNLRKIRKFRDAQKKFGMKTRTFSVKEIKQVRFDLIVVGSDIVWNFKSPFLGQDPIYFGHSLNTQRLISYAPSFGYASQDEAIAQYVIDGLKKFSRISVRDENSKAIVKKAIGYDAKVVLDPTFLYDYTGCEIEPAFDNFILVYGSGLRPGEIEQTRDFAHKNQLKTVAISLNQKWCDHNVVALDPFEWLGFFKKASYIVTSLFHGTIFSIKYNKQFCVSMNEFIENKALPILNRCLLNNQILSGDVSVADALANRIDYDFTNSAIDNMAAFSLDYLRKAIND
ncbi:MAG: polysaccharide pyruvyl transferase family protein [Phycisphaerae bacterium]|nr:polysaccharide pyruvyl transferase family protein [Phycisphaerae bacterium]